MKTAAVQLASTVRQWQYGPASWEDMAAAYYARGSGQVGPWAIGCW